MTIRRRARDAAVLLPLGGVLLFLPPYVRLFDQSGFLFGLPLLHVYIFCIWFVGILLTAWLSRRLIAPDPGGVERGNPES